MRLSNCGMPLVLLANFAWCCKGLTVMFLSSQTTFTSPRGDRILTRSHQRLSASLPSAIPAIHALRGGVLFKQRPAPKNSFLIGFFFRVTTLLTKTGASLRKANEAFRLTDLFAILFFAFAPEIIFKFFNDLVNRIFRKDNPKEYDDLHITNLVGKLLCQVGQLTLFVYIGELFLVFLSGLGVPKLQDKPRLLGSFVYLFWITKQLSNLKDRLLDGALRRYPNRGKFASSKLLYKRITDAVMYLIAALIFLDANHIDVGVAFTSLLTLGGVSSVVIGLALKEPVTEVIQGTSLLFSDKFRPGDVIRLGDGTAGHVVDMKWTDTQIRGMDDSFVRIPNTQIAKTRIINLSRTNRSQVSQLIRIPQTSIDKITKIVQDIKDEIQAACPKLISDGTMPFRVHWTDFEKDSIVITVDCNFYIKRMSDEYWDNRMCVLMAISTAINRNKSA